MSDTDPAAAGETPRVSIVVPVFNEEECLSEFHRRVRAVADGLEGGVEIVYVDDGSSDGSARILATLAAAGEARVITLSRNFGHQAAITAGMERALGEGVITIDADLQDPPEAIPDLLAAWAEGAEVVHAVRAGRKGESRFKLVTARFFYRLIRRWTELDIREESGDFRLYDRTAVDALASLPERARFIRGLSVWVGFRQTDVTYQRDARFAGSTKYPLRRMVALASTALTGFSVVPLQIASVLGFVVALLTVAAIPLVVLARILGVGGLGGQTTVLLAVMFFGGVQLLSIGIVGEYLGRMMVDVKHRPMYLVSSDTALPRNP